MTLRASQRVSSLEAEGGSAALRGALARPRFELVPIAGAADQAAYLPPGATVTITCSPTRGIERTLELAETLAARGFEVVPHVAARQVRDELHLWQVIDRLQAIDCHHIFVIGGDAPEPAGPYRQAEDLLAAICRPTGSDTTHAFTQIGIAGYPEGHPLVDEQALDAALRAKQRYATYVVTQICFDAKAIRRWLSRVRDAGMTLPVHAGLPGVVDGRRLLRISLQIGVGDSLRFVSRHGRLARGLLGGYDPTSIATELAPMLADPATGLAGLHLNTFNSVAATERWRRSLLPRAERGVR